MSRPDRGRGSHGAPRGATVRGTGSWMTVSHNRTRLKEELLMWSESRNIEELQETIDEFTEWYNTSREHSSLDY